MQHERKLGNWMRLYTRVMVGVVMGGAYPKHTQIEYRTTFEI